MTTAPVFEGAAGELVAVAERVNAKRTFLLVSKFLGKHIPVPAALCRLSGAALGLAVAGDDRAEAALAALLTADVAAAARILVDVDARPPAALRDSTVIGFAETATGLAHQVAEALDCTWLQNTTRHPDAASGIVFDESHSHATDQLLRPLPADLPDGPLVIVDDELSTGATAAKLIALLHARAPRERYVIACLVDARPLDPGPLEALAGELETPIDVVSLGRMAVAEPPVAGWSGGRLPERGVPAAEPGVAEVAVDGPGPVERHGADREARRALRELAVAIAARVGPLPPGSLVLGCGEHLALPQLAALAAAPGTLVSSTTRSPALVGTQPGYPLTDGLAFPHPEAPDRPGFAYNVHAGTRPHVVVHFSEPAHRRDADELFRALAPAGAVTAVTLR